MNHKYWMTVWLGLLLWIPIAAAETLQAEYGPPSQAEAWQTREVRLDAASFGVSEAAFEEALASVQTLRVSFEMHDGSDQGGIDTVRLGDVLAADFSRGLEGWTSGGDGTMAWQSSGGDDGGYLHIQDWASGDWHYAVAPADWGGDWRGLIGSFLRFSVMTDHPSYEGRVEILSGPVADQLYLTADAFRVAPGEMVTMTVSLPAAMNQAVMVAIDSSDSAFAAPGEVEIRAGERTARFTVETDGGAALEKYATITVQAPNFRASRATLTLAAQTEPTGSDDPEPVNPGGTNTACEPGVALVSQFDRDDEGWRVGNDVTLTWQASDGEDGGYLRGEDWGDGRTWYFVSPEAWAGDWRGYTGLRFALRLETSSTSFFDDKNLYIVGENGGELAWSDERAPETTWTQYEIPLTAATFKVSEENFSGVMQAVKEIWIRGEFISGGDAEGLDSVALLGQAAGCDTPISSSAAVYDGIAGTLILPSVETGLSRYRVVMKRLDDRFQFQVTGLEIAAWDTPVTATFDGISGKLEIPRVMVTRDIAYAVVMRMIDSTELVFGLVAAEPLVTR